MKEVLSGNNTFNLSHVHNNQSIFKFMVMGDRCRICEVCGSQKELTNLFTELTLTISCG